MTKFFRGALEAPSWDQKNTLLKSEIEALWPQGLFTGQEDNVEVMVKYFLWDRKVHVPCVSLSGHISVTRRQICLKSDKWWIHLIVCQEEWLWGTCEENLSLTNLSLMTSQHYLPFCVKLMLLQDEMCKEQNLRIYGFSFSRGAFLATRDFLVWL